MLTSLQTFANSLLRITQKTEADIVPLQSKSHTFCNMLVRCFDFENKHSPFPVSLLISRYKASVCRNLLVTLEITRSVLMQHPLSDWCHLATASNTFFLCYQITLKTFHPKRHLVCTTFYARIQSLLQLGHIRLLTCASLNKHKLKAYPTQDHYPKGMF